LTAEEVYVVDMYMAQNLRLTYWQL